MSPLASAGTMLRSELIHSGGVHSLSAIETKNLLICILITYLSETSAVRYIWKFLYDY